MKKRSVLPVVALLGAAAAYVSYKVKKEVDKEAAELDAELLEDEDFSPSITLENANYSYLSDENIESIRKKTVDAIDELTRQGDDHSIERPIQQMATFHNVEDEKAFRQEIMRKGYVVSKGDAALEDVILHIAPIQFEKVLPSVLEVADMVKKYSGIYSGWKSKIVG